MATATPPATPEAAPAREGRQRVTFPVVGMSCAACASRIQRQLAATPGVRDAAVNFGTTKATVELDGVPAGALIAAVREAGYDVGSDALTLAITDLRSAPDASRLERAVREVPGVIGAMMDETAS